MTDRVRHTAGFTLAELMMSIAIILILAAIAIPSIVTSQNNMRMVELNNAAQSIANAAQTQMTAMKVSGTWMALINNDEGNVKYSPATNAPDTDTYYMTASDARSNGIVPGLSIDESVRNGDYVIEFTASTAQVVSVFYTDGKSGFFGSAPESTNAAQVCYESEGAVTDQATRLAHDPMIGYYEGTPAGATPEVALKNPVIWVDEKTGRLMVQDPNIADDGGSGSTNTTVSIENKTTGVSFVLSSLSNKTSTLTVSVGGGEGDGMALSNAGKDRVLQQVTREGTSGGNVYSIDLNALSREVSDSTADALKDVFKECTSDNDMTVRAEVTEQTKKSVPATATANIKWPNPVGKLTMLVTNPYSAVVAGGVETSGFTEPTVEAGAINGDGTRSDAVTLEATKISEDTENHLRVSDANSRLSAQNQQAGYQSYAGGWVPSSDVRNDSTFRLEANVGSYNAHAYQIWELWIKRSDNHEAMRVGYLRDGAWEWASFVQGGQSFNYSFLDGCFTWYAANGTAYNSIVGRDTDALNIVSVALDAQALFASDPSQKLVDDDGSATIYVRTAPKMSEVQGYFNQLAESGTLKSTYLSKMANTSTAAETSSRNCFDSTGSYEARAAFEGEFGASSSDVIWAVSGETTTGYDQGNAFLSDSAYKNVRVYYSIAPGLGFSNIRDYAGGNNTQYLTGVRSTGMMNVALWLYRGESYEGLQAMQAASLQLTGDDRYTCRQAGDGRYDFKLTTLEDWRFYRVASYYDGDTKLDIPNQYLPHSGIESAEPKIVVATGSDKTVDGVEYEFKGWTTTDTKSGEPLSVAPGIAFSELTGQLAEKGVRLTAVYEEKETPPDPPDPPTPPTPDIPEPTIGLAYLEFNAQGEVTGYSGYFDDSGEKYEHLPERSNSEIASWGYYVIVPEGSAAPQYQRGGNSSSRDDWAKCALETKAVSVGGESCDLYKAPTSYSGDRTVTLPFKDGSVAIQWDTNLDDTPTYVYTYNFDFAAAVSTDKKDKERWGSKKAPWNVRHWDQFVGCLDVWNVQNKYTSDYFLQTHDIDLMYGDEANPQHRDVQWGSSVFAGTYDGGENAISHYRLQVGADNGIGGLFNHIDGATIKNVSLVDVWQTTNDSEAETLLWGRSAGLLVGEARDSKVENCVVEGATDAAEDAAVRLNLITNGENYVGALIGHAQNGEDGVEVESCTVRNVRIQSSTAFADNQGFTANVGMLIGCAEKDTEIEECRSLDNAIVLTGEMSSNSTATVNLGGLVGSGNHIKIDEKDIRKLDVPVNERYAVSNFKVEISGLSQSPAGVNIGGIAGRLESIEKPPELFEGAVSNVKVETAQASNNLYVGGVVGFVADEKIDTSKWEDKNCYTACKNSFHNGQALTGPENAIGNMTLAKSAPDESGDAPSVEAPASEKQDVVQQPDATPDPDAPSTEKPTTQPDADAPVTGEPTPQPDPDAAVPSEPDSSDDPQAGAPGDTGNLTADDQTSAPTDAALDQDARKQEGESDA